MSRWLALAWACAVALFLAWSDLMYAGGLQYQQHNGHGPDVWSALAIEAILVLVVLVVLLWDAR